MLVVLDAVTTMSITSDSLESEISRTLLDFLHLGHEFFVISGHGT